MLRSTILASTLCFITTIAHAQPMRHGAPDRTEINTALKGAPNHRMKLVSAVLGCFPNKTSRSRDWTCLVVNTGAQIGDEPLVLGLKREQISERIFTVDYKTTDVDCPSAADFRDEIFPLMKVWNVRRIFDRELSVPGRIVLDRTPVTIECRYEGKAGMENYRLTARFSYGPKGYRLEPQFGISETVFDDAGNLKIARE